MKEGTKKKKNLACNASTGLRGSVFGGFSCALLLSWAFLVCVVVFGWLFGGLVLGPGVLVLVFLVLASCFVVCSFCSAFGGVALHCTLVHIRYRVDPSC